jgi:hypothetical protein
MSAFDINLSSSPGNIFTVSSVTTYILSMLRCEEKEVNSFVFSGSNSFKEYRPHTRYNISKNDMQEIEKFPSLAFLLK